MMRLKRIAVLVLFFLLASHPVKASYYEAPYCDPCELYCGGWILGINLTSSAAGDWAIMAGWYNECFLVDLGYNFKAIKGSFPWNDVDHTQTFHEIRGDLGLRYRLCCSNLFLTTGALFSWSPSNTTNELYSVGGFVGLDYQMSRHFLISTKIAPYTFEHLFNHVHLHRVFSWGSVTFAYVF